MRVNVEQKALTVTQISTYFKQIFDAEEMLFNVSVIGEISGLSLVRGVAYFILKDENATMSCVCFDCANFDFNNGDKVIVTGTPKYYVKGGKLNFNISKIQKYGMGELYAKFLELKNKLEQKGYFEQSIKKPMPKSIKRIGVVTSKEGAVIQDIINVRTRRNPNIDIVLYPVKVQGVNAEYEIAHGIKVLDSYDVDLIIVARGGGSLEDLAPFNTEVVADAIFNAKKFILSAVGHETDFSICDFCSDLRAPTPSAAAELVCEDVAVRLANIKSLCSRMENAVRNNYLLKHQQFVDSVQNLLAIYKEYNNQKVYDLKNIITKFKFLMMSKCDFCESKLSVLTSKLKKLEPNEILRLGYATLSREGSMITKIGQLTVGNEVLINLKDGSANAVVTNIKENK